MFCLCVCSGEMELEFWIGLASVQSTFSLFQLIKRVKGGIHCKVKEMQKQCTSTYKSQLKGLVLELGLDFGERWGAGGSVLHPPISSPTTCTVPVGWAGWLVGLGVDVTAACVRLWYRKACVYFRALL